ncbi:hypothetical protein EVAR_50037_1 [Eumeta japonica]|uniref:Uncharacterized protein n=1 Tax=Eumeta variegata TaxID=151549 RepID=A0A4C1XGL1_EUMVA|nr:hypothetical protein EVAR_50037_1 [Eumeta japonica]
MANLKKRLLFFEYAEVIFRITTKRNSGPQTRTLTDIYLQSNIQNTKKTTGTSAPRRTYRIDPGYLINNHNKEEILKCGKERRPGLRLVVLFMDCYAERLEISVCCTTEPRSMSISPGLKVLLNGSIFKTRKKQCKDFVALSLLEVGGMLVAIIFGGPGFEGGDHTSHYKWECNDGVLQDRGSYEPTATHNRRQESGAEGEQEEPQEACLGQNTRKEQVYLKQIVLLDIVPTVLLDPKTTPTRAQKGEIDLPASVPVRRQRDHYANAFSEFIALISATL